MELRACGLSCEQAMAQFQPYKTIQDENPETRKAIRRIIDRSRSAFIHVNNRMEGNAPETIAGIAG